MRMEGGAREETQVRRREAMIASQHVARNYSVVFSLSLSPSFSHFPSHSHLPVLHAYELKVNGKFGGDWLNKDTHIHDTYT